MNILDKALDFIIPRKCAGCGKPREAFCALCADEAYSARTACVFCGSRNGSGEICAYCKRKAKSPLKRVLWAGSYEGKLKKAVLELKYRQRRELAAPLGELIAKKFMSIGNSAEKTFIAIPVPLYFKKERERGFNQAELLAEKFSEITGIEMKKNILEKIKETEPQAKIRDKKLRLANGAGSFSANLEDINPRAKIILIDDVATTGSTLTHAAQALKNAGSKEIIGLVAAHGK